MASTQMKNRIDRTGGKPDVITAKEEKIKQRLKQLDRE